MLNPHPDWGMDKQPHYVEQEDVIIYVETALELGQEWVITSHITMGAVPYPISVKGTLGAPIMRASFIIISDAITHRVQKAGFPSAWKEYTLVQI